MLRHIVVIVLISCLLLPVIAQDTVTNQVLVLVNQERNNIGTTLLVFNPQLIEAAQNHSNDMATNQALSHVGSNGSQFWERIQQAGYTLSTGAENVLFRGDTNAQSVFQQWYDSVPHRTNMLNADYVEVGIAYAQDSGGNYYFTMVLATRPDFVAPAPATAAPVIPTTESPTWTPLPQATATRTIMPTDVALATVIAPLPTNTAAPILPIRTLQPTATESVPPNIRLVYSPESFSLINISGVPLNIANLSFESSTGTFAALSWNTDFLSQSLTGFTADDCLQVWSFGEVNQAKPVDCRYRHAWVAVGADKQFWRDTAAFTVQNGDDLVGVCSVEAGICDFNTSTFVTDPALDMTDTMLATQIAADLRLVYDDNSFALVNVSGRSLDISRIIFSSSEGAMPIERWDTEFLTQSLTSFTADDCLQVWELNSAVLHPQPPSCDTRHAWIAVGDEFDFWRGTTVFAVERDGRRIGLCEVSVGVCNISLSADFGSVASSNSGNTTVGATAAPTSSADVRLVITDTSITLINTATTSIDVSAIAFESDSGVYVASRWNTEFLTRPLNDLPAGDCLQIWFVGGEFEAQPASCDIRHAWVAVAPDEQFWRDVASFRVRWNAQVLATCNTNLSVCDFDLP